MHATQGNNKGLEGNVVFPLLQRGLKHRRITSEISLRWIQWVTSYLIIRPLLACAENIWQNYSLPGYFFFFFFSIAVCMTDPWKLLSPVSFPVNLVYDKMISKVMPGYKPYIVFLWPGPKICFWWLQWGRCCWRDLACRDCVGSQNEPVTRLKTELISTSIDVVTKPSFPAASRALPNLAKLIWLY